MTAIPGLVTHDQPFDVKDSAPIDLTVAFTDLQDFTTYTETEGDDAARRLLIDHHVASAAIVAGRRGRVVKRLGDGLMLTFPDPTSAVVSCLELAEAAPLPLRAGIHTGKVLVTGDDVIGHVVNVAARVMASAAGGQLVVTANVRTAVSNLRGVEFHGPYPRSFKGVGSTVPVYLASRQVCRSATPLTDPSGRHLLDGGCT